MSDISTLGLGLMGSALARSLVDGGHDVTVWNRTPAKMQPLVDVGAAPADSVAEAVEASPVVLVNIDDYPSTRALLDAADVVGKLSGLQGASHRVCDFQGLQQGRDGQSLDP